MRNASGENEKGYFFRRRSISSPQTSRVFGQFFSYFCRPTRGASEQASDGEEWGQKYQRDRGRSPLRTRNVGGTFFAFGFIPPSLPLPCSVLDDVTAKNAVSKGKGRRGREHADDDEDSAREGGEEMAVFPALYSASFSVDRGDPPRSRGLITRFVGVVKCQR